MKKFLIVFAAATVFSLCGCGAVRQDGNEPGAGTEPVSESKVNSKQKSTNTGENKSAEKAPSINKNELKDLGKSVKYMLNKYGKITSAEWIDGPMYQFGENEKWYAFSEYELGENRRYIPKGECTHIFMTFEELLNSPSGEYDIDVFEEAVSSKLTMYYNEMDMINVYEASCGDYEIEVSEMPGKGITADSTVTVTKNIKEE